jgi:hypothetical protein
VDESPVSVAPTLFFCHAALCVCRGFLVYTRTTADLGGKRSNKQKQKTRNCYCLIDEEEEKKNYKRERSERDY